MTKPTTFTCICIVAVHATADGTPGLVVVEDVHTTMAQYEEGMHYEFAKAAVEANGYEPPYIAMDLADLGESLFGAIITLASDNISAAGVIKPYEEV